MLVEKTHWHSGSPQEHAGQASLGIAFKKPTSKRDAHLKWGTENSAASLPTFAKTQATDVYLLKGGGGCSGDTGSVKSWTKREDESSNYRKDRRSERREQRRQKGQKKKCLVCFCLCSSKPLLHFPRIGKEPGYTVGLQGNGAATSALVKTILWPMHRQTGRRAGLLRTNKRNMQETFWLQHNGTSGTQQDMNMNKIKWSFTAFLFAASNTWNCIAKIMETGPWSVNYLI